MDESKLLKQFKNLNVWSKGSQRAPHKPLLVLYALAAVSRGESREILYAQVDEHLKQLLVDFGPPRKSYHPEYPFWRLQNDGLWEVHSDRKLELRSGQTDAKKSELLRYNAIGGFKKPIYRALKNNPKLTAEIAQSVLSSHFPESLHDDIRSAIGLDIRHTKGKSKRDPQFRQKVLTAYEYRCAVCGFDMRLQNQTIGLEAAHIKWHQAGGPDTEDNGLALCVMHHKIFDLGAFTISADGMKVMVSEKAHGRDGFSEWLMRYHDKKVSIPVNPDYSMNSDYILWHNREVFRRPKRPFYGS